MARIQRESYSMKVGSEVKILKLPNVYDGIAQYVGLTKITGAAPTGAGHGNEAQLLLDGQAARIRISYKKDGKYRTSDIICDLDNYKSALGTLPNKQYRGSAIIDAYVPRRRRLG